MKRPLTVLLITLLTILVIYACGSTIRTATTSFVTITIGEDAHIAKLKAEKATVLARTRYLLADLKLMPEAQAYIPSVVQVLVVTVTAADISTPIVGIDSLKTGQTTATIRIEVPNGSARKFMIEGIRGVDSKTYYRGNATVNLTGLDVNIPVTMNFVGTGIYVDPALPITANTLTCGSTPTTACATITYALASRTTGTDAILALAGNYIFALAAPRETFPLQLKTGNALLCLGPNYSSLIDLSTMPSGTVAIKGAEGASVDTCRILGQSTSSYVGIDDRQGATVLNKGITINNVEVHMPYNTFGTSIGIALYSDSPVLESTVTNTGVTLVSPTLVGIQVNSGKPTIQGGMVQGLGTGINLTSGAGDAVITGATVSGNTTGITIVATGKPTVSLSNITTNATGLQVTGGNPSISSNTIRNNTGNGLSITGTTSGLYTGNIIDHNNTGILFSLGTGGNPRVNGNSIFCNTFVGADVTSLTPVILDSNSWNRDATTVPSGPRISGANCLNGDDVCPRAGTPLPAYTPFSTAVSSGCPTP
jgi:hypothetical protein